MGDGVRILNKIARVLRGQRMEAGALKLSSSEVRFTLDEETRSPSDPTPYQMLEANHLVEEFMLFANITVAKRTLRTFPTTSVLRKHPPPFQESFRELVAQARAVGVNIDISSGKSLATSLEEAELKGDGVFNKVLQMKVTTCLLPAEYLCSGDEPQSNWTHYGLATPIYTHFTSPIRRYPDLLVHRLLSSAIGCDPLPSNLRSREWLRRQSQLMNRRHRAAQLAGRSSTKLFVMEFLEKSEGGVVEDGVVVGRKEGGGVRVMLPRFGLEGDVEDQDQEEEKKEMMLAQTNQVFDKGERFIIS